MRASALLAVTLVVVGAAVRRVASLQPYLPVFKARVLQGAGPGWPSSAASGTGAAAPSSGDAAQLAAALGDAFKAAPAPTANITIVVDDPSGPFSSSSGGGTSGGSGGGGAAVAGADNSTDLMAPLVSGDVSGLLRLVPPSAPVSSYSLRIDDMAGLVTPKGYPLEQHVVVTSDGYKLGTFRIPYGRSGGAPAPGVKRPVALLVHGISLASTCWVVNEPAESLAFILADRGWDVWMFNARGNTFSREHVTLKDTQSAFWNFAVDEFALLDFRETIKYIQDATGVERLGVVGHSQGGTIALMALSDDPWLAQSVRTLVALAPCVYVRYMTSVILTNFCSQANTSNVLQFLPPQELLYMSSTIQDTYLNGVCQMPGTMLTCLTTVEGIFGTSQRITAAQYRRNWQIWPSSTSLGNALQWAQIYNEPKPRFFKMNYGKEYDLGQIKVPVVLVSGSNDVLAAKDDIAEQKKRLRKVLKEDHIIPYYSHMDFIWATDAARRVYPIVIQALESSS